MPLWKWQEVQEVLLLNKEKFELSASLISNLFDSELIIKA
jgi:hypothetical protein